MTSSPPDAPPDVTPCKTHESPAGAVPEISSGLGGQEVRKLIRQMSVLTQWRSIGVICLEWTLIVAAFLLALNVGTWWSWLIAVVVIGTRQQALSIMLHDGVHRRLSPSVPLNDFLADMVCGLPLGICLDKNRKLHLAHHRHLGTMKDPDFAAHVNHPEFTFPMSKWHLVKGFLKDFTGVRILSRIRDMGHYSPFSRGDRWVSWFRGSGWESIGTLTFAGRIRSLVFFGLVLPAVAVLTVVFGGWSTFLQVSLLWMIPHMIILPALMRMRSLAEHERCEGEDALDRIRHVQTGILGHLTVAAWNMNCHVVHHLYPSIPFYRLEQVHQALMKVPDYADRCIVTAGYGGRGLVEELTGDFSPV